MEEYSLKVLREEESRLSAIIRDMERDVANPDTIRETWHERGKLQSIVDAIRILKEYL